MTKTGNAGPGPVTTCAFRTPQNSMSSGSETSSLSTASSIWQATSHVTTALDANQSPQGYVLMASICISGRRIPDEKPSAGFGRGNLLKQAE